MTATINRDVWSEILRYFTISFTSDTQDDIRLKRRIMFSIALTCSELVDVALDELWKSMDTLQPIVRVFDTSSSWRPGLQYQNLDGYWSFITSPDEVTLCITRAQSRLNRVQYLHFASFPDSKELALWQALLSLGRTSTLCPNLIGLFLDLELSSPSSVYNLCPLISPGITNVTFVNRDGASGEKAASAILTMLSYHNAKLLEVSYDGHTSPRIFAHITQFSSLRSLSLTPSRYKGGGLDERHIASFQHLTHLTTLKMHMSVVCEPWEQTMGRQLASLGTLSNLELHGTWDEIRNCLFNSVAFSSLRSLSLFLQYPGKSCDTNIFSLINSMFPGLRSLLIDDLPASISLVTLVGILALKERPMEHMSIRNAPIALSTADIIDILSTWPTLKQLSIVPQPTSGVVFWAEGLLPYASLHSAHLSALHLPLDFCSLVLPPTFPPSRCPLQVLELFEPTNLPGSIKEKLTLALNLITMFPRLFIVKASSGAEPVAVGDIQAIIDDFRYVISSPPRRLDCLFY